MASPYQTTTPVTPKKLQPYQEQGMMIAKIKEYEGLYSIRSDGEVISHEKMLGLWSRGEKILKKALSTNGYFTVALCKKSKVKRVSIHRLLADAFIKNNSNKKFVNHKDGNKLNNSIDNLEWVTSKENAIHSYHILKKNNLQGSNNNNSKLSEKDVKFIRDSNDGTSWLSDKFIVSRATINYIRSFKTWKHVL